MIGSTAASPTSSPSGVASDSVQPVASPQQDQELKRCAKRARKLRRQLQRWDGQSSTQRRAAERRWLGSHAVRVDAAVNANEKLPPERRQPAASAFDVASKIILSTPLSEPAKLHWKAKASGQKRPIWDFGIVRRATVEVVRPLLDIHVHSREFQYDRKGIQAAIKDVKSALADGLLYAQRLDISDHYGSFDASELPKLLPLRKKLVEHVVVGKHLPVTVEKDIPLLPELAAKARQGIPQGSGLSPLVALLITSRLNWTAPKGVRLFNYADDFLVMGASEGEVNAAADALADKISSVPGGSFKSKRFPTAHITDGFQFLGHDLTQWDEGLVIMPTLKALDVLYSRIMEKEQFARKALIKLKNESALYPRLAALGDAWVLARSWGKAFRECSEIGLELAAIRIGLNEDLSWFNIPPEFLDDYTNHYVAWKYTSSIYTLSAAN